jgi:hypothetical protein
MTETPKNYDLILSFHQEAITRSLSHSHTLVCKKERSPNRNQAINNACSQPINQSTNQPINQSTNQPINQSTNQPINQSTNQPIKFYHTIEESFVISLETTGKTHLVFFTVP